MDFNFLNSLALVTIFAGVVALVDMILRRRKKMKHPVVIDYARLYIDITHRSVGSGRSGLGKEAYTISRHVTRAN
jgi:hypothetical protein